MKTDAKSLTLGPGESKALLIVQERGEEASFDIRLEKGASLRLVLLSLAGCCRNSISVELAGRGASCRLAGLALPKDEEKMSCSVELVHSMPECHSTQLFKSLVDGSATYGFDGLIRVAPDAQKTEAYQASHNLLLSEQARADSRPQLEIYADDVKCSHGATVGRLNPDELFYLRSRGIREEDAKLLQQLAFASEVMETIEDPALREEMLRKVEARLRKS